jgi:hypothetical protein
MENQTSAFSSSGVDEMEREAEVESKLKRKPDERLQLVGGG